MILVLALSCLWAGVVVAAARVVLKPLSARGALRRSTPKKQRAAGRSPALLTLNPRLFL